MVCLLAEALTLFFDYFHPGRSEVNTVLLRGRNHLPLGFAGVGTPEDDPSGLPGGISQHRRANRSLDDGAGKLTRGQNLGYTVMAGAMAHCYVTTVSSWTTQLGKGPTRAP